MFLTLTSREPNTDHSSASGDPGGSHRRCCCPRTFSHRHSRLRSRNPNAAGSEAHGHTKSPQGSWARESMRVQGQSTGRDTGQAVIVCDQCLVPTLGLHGLDVPGLTTPTTSPTRLTISYLLSSKPVTPFSSRAGHRKQIGK